MKKFLLSIICVAAWLLIILAGLFTTLQVTLQDREAFKAGYEKMGIEAKIGISAGDCTNALMKLVDYMEGRTDSIQLTVTENGQTVEMYNQQEIDHMVDVRALYQAFRLERAVGAALLALLVALGAVLRHKHQNRLLRVIPDSYGTAATLFFILLIVLGIWVAVDFNGFWTQFHLLFFTNDLWLMNPATCRMIRICPLELFYGIVVKFGLIFFGILLAITLLNAIVFRRAKQKKPGKNQTPQEN